MQDSNENLRSVAVKKVFIITTLEGEGKEDNPFRNVERIYDSDSGDLIANLDSEIFATQFRRVRRERALEVVANEGTIKTLQEEVESQVQSILLLDAKVKDFDEACQQKSTMIYKLTQGIAIHKRKIKQLQKKNRNLEIIVARQNEEAIHNSAPELRHEITILNNQIKVKDEQISLLKKGIAEHFEAV